MTGDASLARLLPVIDILGGQVVHARNGNRREYRSLVSRLIPSSPVLVAKAFRQLGLTDLYVADLDALQGGQPDWNTYTALKEIGSSLWIDAGIRTAEDAVAIRHAGADKVILALETIPSPRLLPEVLARLGPQSVVFSLDMRQGVPQTLPGVWERMAPGDISREVIGMGIRQVILLDVADVGTEGGTGTGELCRMSHAQWPEVTFITGGGIHSPEGVREQTQLGASYVLTATALHERRLP